MTSYSLLRFGVPDRRIAAVDLCGADQPVGPDLVVVVGSGPQAGIGVEQRGLGPYQRIGAGRRGGPPDFVSFTVT